MSLDLARFRHEYDLDALERIRPRGQTFEMLVTPRYRRHFVDRVYEPLTAPMMRAMSRSHELFVDIGAHYGFFSLVATSRNPTIEILACEPVPESYEVLLRNLALNGQPTAQTVRKAVSDRSGTASFQVSHAADNCSFYPHPAAPPLRQVEVETVTVDQLLAGRRACPTLVKMDTDGHELAVLAGMAETFERLPELKLFVELNPKMQQVAGHEPEELVAELDRLGFDVYLLDDDSRRAYRLGAPSGWRELMPNPESYVNLYCCRKARSLSVCLFSHSSRLAGAERSLLELATELVEDHGVVCTVVLPENGPLVDRLAAAGVATLEAGYSWWGVRSDAEEARNEERDFASWLGPSAQILLGEPLEKLRRVDPHVLVTHTIAIPWGALLAPILGKPHAWHVCEYVDHPWGFRFSLPFQEVVKVVRDSSEVVFTATHGVGRHLFPEDPEERWSTLYRHVEVPAEPSSTVLPALFHRPGALRLGHFATQVPVKGQDVVVRAVSRVVAHGWDVELVLAGDGREAYREEVASLIEREGLRDVAHLHDFVPNVYEVMRQTDVVVVGSRVEAFCRTAVEAMLLGKPVVYPNTGGPGEYMRPGVTGLPYEPGDPEGMAEALESLLRDPGLRAEIGRRAKEHALETFTRDGFGGTAYRALLELRGHAPRVAPQWAALLATLASEARDEAVLWRTRHDTLREARDELNGRLRDAEREARELEHRLSETRRALDRTRRELAKTKAGLSRASRQRDEVLESTTWSMAIRLRRPLDRVAPPGSRLRKLLAKLSKRRHRDRD